MFPKKRKSKKRIIFSALLILLGAVFFRGKFFQNIQTPQIFSDSENKKIVLLDSGLSFEMISKANTVEEFLKEQKIELAQYDVVYPKVEEKVFGGTSVVIQRAKKITVKEGERKQEIFSLKNTVEEAIWENKDIALGDDDITVPSRKTLIKNGMTIVVTHVVIKEEIKNEPIAFKTTTNEDAKLGWRITKTTQKGEKGNREVKYKVVYHNDKEISRKILEKNVNKEPVDEIITQGTLVKVGKIHTGVASWYAYTGTLSAANPWLPMGSYVRVTNKDNGKSVIVKINDRGPFGNGRIIDLDKVAFEKIAPLGQGTAEIKMEVITN
ncbi:MAG: DUF348 domain-containing protein [Candidatus Moranbacteria bacterium]|nr:DUF348 domain-containing protein [Candidatus Moranbacteria bacterium]